MDKALFTEEVNSMLPELMAEIGKECGRLYDSGGVDTAAYGDDYQLPKLCLTIAIENQARQYRPLDKRQQRIASNLRHF